MPRAHAVDATADWLLPSAICASAPVSWAAAAWDRLCSAAILSGVKTTAAQLPDNVEALERLVLEQHALIEQRQLEIERLRLILARMRRERYGRSSEVLDQEIEQLELTLEEAEKNHAAIQMKLASVTEAPAEKPVRQELPSHLPREESVHGAPAAVGCTCPDCGGALRSMGSDVTEVLERIPERFMVVRHVRPKFSCEEVREDHPGPCRQTAVRGWHGRRFRDCPCVGVEVL